MGRFHGSACFATACLIVTLLSAGCDRDGSASISSDGRTSPAEIEPVTPAAGDRDPSPPVEADAGTNGSETVQTPNGAAPEVEQVASMPQVLMSQADEETCLVKVQDVFPAVELVDLQGQSQTLRDAAGEKLTVVFFWTMADVADARQQQRARADLEDLKYDAAEAFAEHGLKVVAVNVGNTAEDVRQQLRDVDIAFPMLLDTDGAVFGQVATERMPRVYLLDAEGHVLWFDIEFSRSTRRDLTQAIQFSLRQP